MRIVDYIGNPYPFYINPYGKNRRTISESGRSLVLQIPKDVERTLSLKSGDIVNIWIENSRIVIEKLASLVSIIVILLYFR